MDHNNTILYNIINNHTYQIEILSFIILIMGCIICNNCVKINNNFNNTISNIPYEGQKLLDPTGLPPSYNESLNINIDID